MVIYFYVYMYIFIYIYICICLPNILYVYIYVFPTFFILSPILYLIFCSVMLDLPGRYTSSWNSKRPVFHGCFNWMIPNLYIKNGCSTKHPLKNGCLVYQVCNQSTWHLFHFPSLHLPFTAANPEGRAFLPTGSGVVTRRFGSWSWVAGKS